VAPTARPSHPSRPPSRRPARGPLDRNRPLVPEAPAASARRLGRRLLLDRADGRAEANSQPWSDGSIEGTMRASFFCAITVVSIGGLSLIEGPAAARVASTVPRTPWGHPDFQGVTWNFATMTPLERPRDVEVPVFTEAEAAAFERQTVQRQS